jgi:HAE1 family hydrophobic/amphiphilic exporter-1
VAVVGGLFFSQFLTLYVTPTFYVSMERMIGFFRGSRKGKEVPAIGR